MTLLSRDRLFSSRSKHPMPRSRMLVLLLLIAAVCLYCYDSASPIRVVAIVIKSSTLIYKVIEVNDRRPVYRLATLDGRKPEVNGDQAQATVVEHLKLAEQCQRDPSLIVVDVGAYVGKSVTNERSIRSARTSLLCFGNRRLRTVCCCLWLSSLSVRSATGDGRSDSKLYYME